MPRLSPLSVPFVCLSRLSCLMLSTHDKTIAFWLSFVLSCLCVLSLPSSTFLKSMYSQTCVQRPPLGPEKSGRLTEGV